MTEHSGITEGDSDDYRDLADVIIAAFNPPDDDVAEFAIVIDAVRNAARFIESQPCCCRPAATDPDVLDAPCKRCRVLGRRADKLEER
jgi:hypothetical protein